MPPIDLFTNAGINPNQATTAAADSAQHAANESTSSTTNTTPYPAARPGAAAMPAPTAAAQSYAPPSIQPTPTTTSSFPPTPQPGATPLTSIPPPPTAGRAFVQPAPTTTYPSQMYIPPPTAAYGAQPPASSTSTTTTPSYPVPLPISHLENPVGYTQNKYASDLTPDQRSAQQASLSSSDYGRNESTGDTSSLAMDAQNAWDTAKSWAKKAGETLSEAESEVWKRVNK